LGTAANNFRIIPEDHPLPGRAVSLLGEYLKMSDVHPQWMMGDSHRREWLCPIYGQSTEMELLDFLYFLIRLLKPELVIEGGCHVGLGSYAIGRALQDNGHGRSATSDINLKFAEIAAARCQDLPLYVRHCSVTELPIQEADFLYLDCDSNGEKPDEIRLELLAKANPGALVLMHDTRHEPHLAEGIAKTQRQFINFKQTWRGFSLIQL
jgi:predicted O-methyltransferase YrrM